MKIYTDFEANGINHLQEIISIGCIAEDGQSFYSLVRPHEKLDKRIRELTHISEDEAQIAPSLEEVMRDFSSWLSKVTHGEPYTFLVFGNSDRDFVNCSIRVAENNITKEILQDLHDNIQRVDKQIAAKFNRKTIGLRSAYLTMRLSDNEPVEQNHNALEDAMMLKYICENISNYELPEGVQVISVPKIDMSYQNKGHRLTGKSTKTRAKQALRACPQLADKKYHIRVRATKGNRRPVCYNKLVDALSLVPFTIVTAEKKLECLEKMYQCVKSHEPYYGWTLEEIK